MSHSGLVADKSHSDPAPAGQFLEQVGGCADGPRGRQGGEVAGRRVVPTEGVTSRVFLCGG